MDRQENIHYHNGIRYGVRPDGRCDWYNCINKMYNGDYPDGYFVDYGTNEPEEDKMDNNRTEQGTHYLDEFYPGWDKRLNVESMGVLRETWVEALKSAKYVQTPSNVSSAPVDSFCALGALIDVNMPTIPKTKISRWTKFVKTISLRHDYDISCGCDYWCDR